MAAFVGAFDPPSHGNLHSKSFTVGPAAVQTLGRQEAHGRSQQEAMAALSWLAGEDCSVPPMNGRRVAEHRQTRQAEATSAWWSPGMEAFSAEPLYCPKGKI